MKNKMKTLLSTLALSMLMAACGDNTPVVQEATETEKTEIFASKENLEIIQFHSEHRCMTCNKIESLTLETLQKFEDVPFRLVNVDDPAHEEMAAEFEAAGTALFLHNTKTGAKQELTDFAFMNAHDDEKYIAKLREEIADFD